ncbi:hypothetical protein M758_3G128800 [Ceratodon purpureus]|nr:hypothetical protein M758_3G128800 [Ceratodon purpureus]
MADPKVPEPELTSQGQVYQRATKSDETVPELQPQYRGGGATPQQKEDENKHWISEGHNDANVEDQNRDGLSRHQYDTYARELDKRLGPIAYVKDKIADTVETAIEKVSATSNSVGDDKISATGTFSQYTQAAWEKMNELKPTIGGN